MIRPYRLLLAVVAAIFVLLAGCDLLTGDERSEIQGQILDRIDENEQQWQNQGMTRYQFTYGQQVGDEFIDTVRVFVSDGTLDSVRASEPVDESELVVKNVDGFFQTIREKVGREDVLDLTANFSDSLGYPTRYSADFDNRPTETVLGRGLKDRTE